MMENLEVKVECYSGCKLNERPLNFILADKRFEIEEILDQWYGPDYNYFKVRAEDKNIYILKYDEAQDRWQMEFFTRSDL